MPGSDMVSGLKEFTIRTAVKLLKAPGGKELTILGHSSCGCWALLLNVEGILTFGPRCDENIISSGYHLPVD